MEKDSLDMFRIFTLEGVISDDAQIWQRREDYLQLLSIQMRNLGYVPRLDIDADFRTQYNSKKNSYTFSLAAFGVYVGERESEWIFGIDEEGPIPIPQSRSKASYSEVE
jgi:hypothetical protein